MKKPPYTGRGSRARHPRPKISIGWEQVVPPYREGKLCREIAAPLGVSEESVRRALAYFEEPRRPRGAGAIPKEKNNFWRGGKGEYQAQKYWARKIATYCYGELPPGSVVHHVDEDPHNNEPSNLRLFLSAKDHLRVHYLLAQLPQPVSLEVASRVASENGGLELQRPPALDGWLLDRVPPVLSGSPGKRMPSPTAWKRAQEKAQRSGPRQ